MKATLFAVLMLSMAGVSMAQLPGTEPDKSPLDLSYHPHAYPILRFQSPHMPATPYARVLYSRPARAGRTIFGEVVKYNELWRLGANESTEITFYQDVTIQNKKIPKGRYTLFCIPQPARWTLILNKDLDTWGAFSYRKESDVLRVELPVQAIDSLTEHFTMLFDPKGQLMIQWDQARVVLPIRYKAGH